MLAAYHLEALSEAWRIGLEPPPRDPPQKWCIENLTLSEKVTARPGPLDLSLTPYAVEWLESYADRSVQEVVIASASQVAKSIFVQAAIGWTIPNDPAPALFVLPNEKDARSFSKQRLQPLIDSSAALVAEKLDDPDEWTLLEMGFGRMVLNVVGSNSPSRLSSRPVGRLFVDEVDKLAGSTATEAPALELARNRVRTFTRHKVVLTSTPTLQSGPIWRAYLAGDRRRFELPCPKCGKFAPLEWRNVLWPNSCRRSDGSWNLAAVRRETFVICRACEFHIRDEHKEAMLAAGRWTPTREGKPRVRSYQLSGLYPPWAEFGALAVEYLSKKDNYEDYRDFVNSVLGRPWKEKATSAGDDAILAHRGKYAKGTCPAEPLEVFLTVDKQESGYWFVVRAWGEGGASWLLDDGFLVDDKAVLEVAEREYDGPSGPLGITQRFMDSSAYTDDVYAFCKANGFKPWKGYGGEPQTFAGNWSKQKNGVRLFVIRTNYCKDALQRKISAAPEAPGYWSLHAETDGVYAAQIAGEQAYLERDKRGVEVTRWRVVGPNHLLDCEVAQVALSIVYRVKNRKRRRGRPMPGPAGDDPAKAKRWIDKPPARRPFVRTVSRKGRDDE